MGRLHLVSLVRERFSGARRRCQERVVGLKEAAQGRGRCNSVVVALVLVLGCFQVDGGFVVGTDPECMYSTRVWVDRSRGSHGRRRAIESVHTECTGGEDQSVKARLYNGPRPQNNRAHSGTPPLSAVLSVQLEAWRCPFFFTLHFASSPTRQPPGVS